MLRLMKKRKEYHVQSIHQISEHDQQIFHEQTKWLEDEGTCESSDFDLDRDNASNQRNLIC